MKQGRCRWLGYMRNVVRAYPALRAAVQGGGASGLTPHDLREYRAVDAALAECGKTERGRERAEVVRLALMGGNLPLEQVAYRTYVSYSTAKRHYNAFLRMVAGRLFDIEARG